MDQRKVPAYAKFFMSSYDCTTSNSAPRRSLFASLYSRAMGQSAAYRRYAPDLRQALLALVSILLAAPAAADTRNSGHCLDKFPSDLKQKQC